MLPVIGVHNMTLLHMLLMTVTLGRSHYECYHIVLSQYSVVPLHSIIINFHNVLHPLHLLALMSFITCLRMDDM